ncbi:hypothetical protein AC249_AIPGENE21214 [Exaiptasia diaphana]|nr:hypothetical protein AC249_AIPGENE21214 [Exaiptasia diaphana]
MTDVALLHSQWILPTYPLDVWYLWDSLKERSSSTKWMVKSLKYDNVSQYNFTSANSLDFELHLTPSSTPLIDLVAEYIPSVFTMCLWTKHDGEEIYVKLQERKSSDRYIMMNISKIVAITVKLSSKSSFLKLDINMMTTWHFYCIEVNIKEISFYFDGKIAIRQQKFKGSYRDEGRLQVGYVNQKNADTAPVLAYLNIWKSALGDHILARMAFGCGEAHINNSVIVSWQLFSGLKEKNVRRKSPASCKVRKDKAMLLEGRSESILIGPVMSKTSKYASLCFYFTYMMLGESKKALEVEVINKEDMKSMINPIWYARDYANGEWHLGSVPIRSTMSYQISIRGNIASTSGAILLGYAYQSNQPCGQERLDHGNIV